MEQITVFFHSITIHSFIHFTLHNTMVLEGQVTGLGKDAQSLQVLSLIALDLTSCCDQCFSRTKPLNYCWPLNSIDCIVCVQVNLHGHN